MQKLEPPSDWHAPGNWTLGSQADREAMSRAAFPCTVVALRWRGRRTPAAELLRIEPPTGLLVCLNRYTAPHWYACLFKDSTMCDEALPRLLQVNLARENGGVRLYRGVHVEERTEYPQGWLCGPSAKVREILLQMADREGGV